jgi:hypothetical protein
MLYGRGSIAVRKSHGDAEARQQVSEECTRRPVELGDGDDIPTHRGQVEHRIMQGGLSAADAERLNTPLERSDPPFQHADCWVTDAGVPVSSTSRLNNAAPCSALSNA